VGWWTILVHLQFKAQIILVVQIQLPPSIMVKSYHKNNIAIARNFQHNPSNDNPSPPSDHKTDSELDCGYEGGVNCNSSDDEYDPTDTDENWLSDESLAELEGDELETNLQALQQEVKSLDAPTAFKVMMAPKDGNDWKKVEANWALGYMKNSTHIKERRRKKECE
jgi:hypothetical protein